MKMSISRRRFLKVAAATAGTGATWPALRCLAEQTNNPAAISIVHPPPAPKPIRAPKGFGVARGPFQPTWESLCGGYRVPDWFRDAKFGIWAHWGPQCQPEMGDWYAKKMYEFGSADYKFHVKRYGHPSKFGFKDVIHEWKAEAWDPVHLISLYKRAGAKYFSAMANHHDNFDMFHSRYQPWNSVAIGPKKDIVGSWAKAARAAGLRFAVSSHGDRAWGWYQEAQGADPVGPLAGVPYDGRLSKADGTGHWWNGLDPQDLYAQYHPVGHYNWQQTGSPPMDKAYCEKFFNRTIDLIDKYQPDLIYFDDDVLPIFPASDIGLRIAAYFYNTNLARQNGKLEAVITGKHLNPDQRRALVLDVERGVTQGIETLPWQTDTCIGSWHYQRSIFDKHEYKTAEQVTQMLVDIVSKNGNLQLNIPLPGSGLPDVDELKFLSEFTAWMDVNSEAIHGTRPWTVYGEGPSVTNKAPVGQFGGARDIRSYVAEDMRFTTKGDSLYAFIMDWPESRKALITSLAPGTGLLGGRKVTDVSLLGHGGKIDWTQDERGLSVQLPGEPPCKHAVALRIKGVLA